MTTHTRAAVERRSLYTRSVGVTDDGVNYRSITMSEEQWRKVLHYLIATTAAVLSTLGPVAYFSAHSVVKEWIKDEDQHLEQKIDAHAEWADKQVQERRENTITRREFEESKQELSHRLMRMEVILDRLYLRAFGEDPPPPVKQTAPRKGG